MIEESLLQSNFLGRDGFRWWIGQIPPGESLGSQNKGGGWGNRFKVRIMGYHPYNKADLPDEDLPWAGCLLPATSGTGASNMGQSVKYRPGDVVVGFFMDGDNAQIPMIMGAFGRTSQVPQDQSSSDYGFIPFTGYTSNIDVPDGTLAPDESLEQNANSQKSPRTVSKKQVDNLNSDVTADKTEIPASKAQGLSEVFADSCDDNFISNVSSHIDNLLLLANTGGDILADIAAVTKSIQRLSNGLVSTMTKGIYDFFVPLLGQALNGAWQFFKTTLGGGLPTPPAVLAMQGLIQSLGIFEDTLKCILPKVINGLETTIRNLLEDTLINVINGGICIVEQAAGSLVNDIAGKIESLLAGPLDAISVLVKFLGVPFNGIKNLLLSSQDVLAAIGGFFVCESEDKGKCVGTVKKWTIGYGGDGEFDLLKSYQNITANANASSLLAAIGVEATNSPYTKPDCSEPSFCGGPTVEIFGGDGVGGAAKAILGGIVNNTSGLSDITRGVAKTGSIIGVQITDPGSGYFYKPPFIRFKDSCGLGYGAVGQAKVDFNPKSPTYGQIVNVVMLSEGENYPISENNDNDSINSEELTVGIVDIQVIIPGSGYESETTTVTDNLGTEYTPNIVDGRIISINPSDSVRSIVKSVPKITITSTTGTGAFAKPIIRELVDDDLQGDVIQVIDCV